jgi:glycosyltransferase involved in cell wall biosynthesis
MKVALVYDRVNKWGGAERVLLALHQLFPDAPLFTSVYDEGKASWAKVFTIKTSFLQQFAFTRSNHEFIPFLMPIAFEQFTFDEYDLVISLTSEAAKGIITKPGSKHICYCLTPTRYLWSGYDDYLNTKTKKILASPFVSYLRTWDTIAAQRPDVYVAASAEVEKRIKTYYGRDSSAVIFPPTDLISAKGSKKSKGSKNGKYFLVVSRFVPYKRIDLAIKVANRLQVPLKIIGSGREEPYLRSLAGPTVEFLGILTDDQLIDYYTNSKGLLFPGVEDFGLTVIEAQYFGKPVIAFRGGGALETIVEGKTGIFFDKQTEDSLVEALQTFATLHFDPEACRKQAEKFSIEAFQSKFRALVKKVI